MAYTKLFDPSFCACMKNNGPPHVCTSPAPPLIYDQSLSQQEQNSFLLCCCLLFCVAFFAVLGFFSPWGLVITTLTDCFVLFKVFDMHDNFECGGVMWESTKYSKYSVFRDCPMSSVAYCESDHFCLIQGNGY